MELNYPSNKDNNLDVEMKKIDRRYGSIILSNSIRNSLARQLPNSLKKSIIQLISKDQQHKLITLMNEQVVKLTDEISKKGLGWNLLHYMAKHNASCCLQVCLKMSYQEDPKSYEDTIDSRNIDGQTPLIVAFENNANDAIKVILNFGGLDIHALNNKKMTAYQIALSKENEEGLQMLMKYQLKIKQRHYINVSVLSQPIEIKNQRKCQWLIKCLVDCFCFRKDSQESQQSQTDRKILTKTPQTNSFGLFEVQWKPPLSASGSIQPLFTQQINPFSIKQNAIIVTNLLVFFQCIAQYTQILRNLIFKVDEKYYVKFATLKGNKVIWMDNLFPYISHSQQPLFLSLNDQIWPMVLQKALSQFYNGYFQPGKISFGKLFQIVTGNYAYSISISDHFNEETIIQLLQKLQVQNCLYVLQPKEQCPIKCPEGRKQCFSVLKFMNNKILLNVPFVSEEERIREAKQSIQMKIQKAHYNNPNTMALWLSTAELHQYFSHIIFCHTVRPTKQFTFQPYLTSNRVHLKFKIKKHVKGSTISIESKDKNQDTIIPIKVTGWMINGSKKKAQKASFDLLGRVTMNINEYCQEFLLELKFQLPLVECNDEIKIKYQSQAKLQVQVLDNAIGDLQYIECCKKYFNTYFERYQAPIIEEIGNYVLVMAASSNPCYIVSQYGLEEQKIVQGILTDNNTKLQMFPYEKINFCVLTNISGKEIEKMQVISLEEVEDSQENDHYQ